MALVNYSSSEEVEGEAPSTTKTNNTTTIAPLKRKRTTQSSSDLPPLPSKFHDLYASTTRVSTSDDPSLHGGRKRVNPHIEGNWPTHLYIEWYPSPTEYDVLSALISSLQPKNPPSEKSSRTIHSSLISDLDAPLPLHISLSRTLGFPTSQKDNFLNSLEQGIRSSSIRPFEIHFLSLDWVPNFGQTRWFLVLRLQKPSSDGLNKLLHVSNKTVQDHGQPPLYSTSPIIERKKNLPPKNSAPSRKQVGKVSEAPSSTKIDWSEVQDVSHAFHVSIAWTLDAPGPELLTVTRAAEERCMKDLMWIRLQAEEIKAKIGNVVTNIPLSTGVVERKGAFVF